MKIPVVVEGGARDNKPVVVARHAAGGAPVRGNTLDAARPDGAPASTVLYPTTLRLPTKGCWTIAVSYERDLLDFTVDY